MTGESPHTGSNVDDRDDDDGVQPNSEREQSDNGDALSESDDATGRDDSTASDAFVERDNQNRNRQSTPHARTTMDPTTDQPEHTDFDSNATTTDQSSIQRPDEMDLEELRKEIEEIDHDIVELIARRTYVADTIAQVKAAKELPTTDERQEARVMERAGENADRFDVDANLVKAIFRLLIELNKVEQREKR